MAKFKIKNMASEKELNNIERMKYVEKWADYVTKHKNWSKLQKELIDSQLENAFQVKLTKEQVRKIKE